MNVEVFVRTDPGPVRENNEDSFLVEPSNGLFAVADGMGGHAAGEVASLIAVDTIKEVILGTEDPDETRIARPIQDEEELLRERLRYAMNQASIRIRQKAQDVPAYKGMGTTLTVLLIEEDVAHFSHVGDSRLYLYRDGMIRRLTRDHTVVQNEIDAGRLTPELARRVPHRNILTQSVGINSTVEPDTSTRPIDHGDLFLLCSDGLTDPLSDSDLEMLCGNHPVEDLAEVLVQKAIEQHTVDNVTVIVILVEEE
jgi:PPM family protein phosphatase